MSIGCLFKDFRRINGYVVSADAYIIFYESYATSHVGLSPDLQAPDWCKFWSSLWSWIILVMIN